MIIMMFHSNILVRMRQLKICAPIVSLFFIQQLLTGGDRGAGDILLYLQYDIVKAADWAYCRVVLTLFAVPLFYFIFFFFEWV